MASRPRASDVEEADEAGDETGWLIILQDSVGPIKDLGRLSAKLYLKKQIALVIITGNI